MLVRLYSVGSPDRLCNHLFLQSETREPFPQLPRLRPHHAEVGRRGLRVVTAGSNPAVQNLSRRRVRIGHHGEIHHVFSGRKVYGARHDRHKAGRRGQRDDTRTVLDAGEGDAGDESIGDLTYAVMNYGIETTSWRRRAVPPGQRALDTGEQLRSC
jgi:hypothetical protein